MLCTCAACRPQLVPRRRFFHPLHTVAASCATPAWQGQLLQGVPLCYYVLIYVDWSECRYDSCRIRDRVAPDTKSAWRCVLAHMHMVMW
jgi:hypothetical protein